MKQAPRSSSTQKSVKSTQKAKPQKSKQTLSSQQKQGQQQQSPMIATSNAPSALGGVWIDATSPSHHNHHDNDGETVISEMTADHTAFNTANGGGNGDALEELLQFMNSGAGQAPVTPTNTMKKAPPNPNTPSTVQSTPDRSLMAAQAPKKKRASTKNTVDDGTFTDQPSASTSRSNATGETATGTGGTATATGSASASTSKQPAKVSRAKSPPDTSNNTSPTSTNKTPAKKNAPRAGMDVTPNPRVQRKPKATSAPNNNNSNKGRTANASPTTTANRAGLIKAAPKPAPTNTNTTAGNKNLGLSELSKQLRLQRAKNEWQHQEIARLERQLRILSDLKGVSVADLRVSLESACAEEAHGELRNQVLSLQAQLEALQMQRDSSRKRASTAGSEATDARIATLQLRIGELEEVDHAKQAEVHSLYQQLQEQTAKATTLEATSAQQVARIQQFEAVAKQYINDVQRIQAERDDLKQQVQALTQQLQDQQSSRALEMEMRNIEEQLQKEKQRKQEYLNQARAQQQQQQQNQQHQQRSMAPAVNNRLSSTQLAAISGVVGRQAGVPATTNNLMTGDASTIATSVAQDDGTYMSSNNSSVMTGPNQQQQPITPQNPFDSDDYDDEISHLDMMDMSVHTMDALLMQGLSEEQAKEALAKDAKITSLYEELREQATKASQLQTLCANQKTQLDRFAQDLNEKENVLKSTKSDYSFAKTEHDSLYQRFCDIELQLTLEQEKVEGLERQLNARTHESNLRNDQFKCRFQVQNERIADLEQQQQSLYAAFELLQQEVKAQDSEHNKLKSSLDEADSEVARQLRKQEKKKERRPSHQLSSPDASRRSLMESSGRDLSSSPTVTATPVSPYASLNESSSSLFIPQELTPQQQGIDHPMQMYGYLYKLDKLKGWKKRFFALYGEGGVYNMTYSDGPRERVKGNIHNITMGVSTVAETNKSVKKPFSFVLHVDPLQHNAPVLYAAALTADDFRKWMGALKAATIRPEDGMFMSRTDLSAEAQIEADMEVARQVQSTSSRDLNHDADAQIEADHLMAMRMSIANQPNQAYA